MALTTERIRDLWENYSPTKGIESFARSVEAEARRDALEEAAKVCDEQTQRSELSMQKAKGVKAREIYSAAAQTSAWNAAAIRKLKEDTQ